MRKYILLFSILFFSCEDYPKYIRTYESTLPDSLQEAKQKFIIELVTAASYHMTGGDYEDPEDVIQQAAYTFDEIHETYVEGLRTYRYHGDYGIFTPAKTLIARSVKFT